MFNPIKLFHKNFILLNTGFSEHPFIAWHIVYLLALILSWQIIQPFLQFFQNISVWLEITLLLIIPATLYYQESVRLKQEEQKNKTQFKAEITLTEYQLARIQSILPTSQLDLFQVVLLPSLRIIKAALSAIPVQNHIDSNSATKHHQSVFTPTLFDEKFATICQVLTNLVPMLSTESSHQEKTKNQAITTFVFYRTLFSGVLEQFYQHRAQNASADPLQNESSRTSLFTQKSQYFPPDPHILLKRIPLKLMFYFGAQYWRLYELQEVIYGDLSKLRLNQDIAPILTQLSQNNIKNQTELKQELDESSATTSSDETTDRKKFSNMVVISNSSQIDEINLDQKTKRMIQKFKQWLGKQINGSDPNYQLNQGELVFAQSLRFGSNTVFVTDLLLDQYQSKHNIAREDIQAVLKFNTETIHNKKYFVIQDEIQLTLTRIDNILIEKQPTLAVKIVEVDDGNAKNFNL